MKQRIAGTSSGPGSVALGSPTPARAPPDNPSRPGGPVSDILLSAGEASGDLHAGGVAAAIGALDPAWHLVGVGAAHMRSAGVELEEDIGTSAVMGFVEILAH